MADLRVNLFGKQLAGPVIAASGTFGFGPEYAGIEDLRVLGGISGKGLTLNGQPGNDGERLLETPSGLMNSIGLQNPGVQHFIENELPAMKTCGTSVWVNLGGHTIEENVEGVQKLCAAGIDVLELNISCPNVKQGGLAFGIRAADAGEVVSAVRKVCTEFAAAGKVVAAICAAPSVLAAFGILQGKKATVYPGMEDKLTAAGAEYTGLPITLDGNIITGEALGAAIPFALALASRLAGQQASNAVKQGIVYRY